MNNTLSLGDVAQINDVTWQGKTDIAMLAILRVLGQFSINGAHATSPAAIIERGAFKIVYV